MQTQGAGGERGVEGKPLSAQCGGSACPSCSLGRTTDYHTTGRIAPIIPHTHPQCARVAKAGSCATYSGVHKGHAPVMMAQHTSDTMEPHSAASSMPSRASYRLELELWFELATMASIAVPARPRDSIPCVPGRESGAVCVT
jgi:hypothetical protein